MSQDLNESRVKKVYFGHFTVVIATSLIVRKGKDFSLDLQENFLV